MCYFSGSAFEPRVIRELFNIKREGNVIWRQGSAGAFFFSPKRWSAPDVERSGGVGSDPASLVHPVRPTHPHLTSPPLPRRRSPSAPRPEGPNAFRAQGAPAGPEALTRPPPPRRDVLGPTFGEPHDGGRFHTQIN